MFWKILKYNLGEKSPFAIYLDLECLLKKEQESRDDDDDDDDDDNNNNNDDDDDDNNNNNNNNLKKSYTEKKAMGTVYKMIIWWKRKYTWLLQTKRLCWRIV